MQRAYYINILVFRLCNTVSLLISSRFVYLVYVSRNDCRLLETPHFLNLNHLMVDFELSGFHVQSVTDEVFYIPEFVSIDEESYLMRKVRRIDYPRESEHLKSEYHQNCIDH